MLKREKMKISEIELPSNRKFGWFFAAIFAVAAFYFFYNSNVTWASVCITTSFILFLIGLVKSDILLPLNKLWMRFGLLLGMIVSPIVLGVVFFGIFTPIALLMRLGGRDELRLKFGQKSTHWISRNEPIKPGSFKNQF